MNTKVDLKFSKFLKAEWLSDVRNYEVNDATIVVNISNTDAIIAGPAPRKVIHPRKSTILEGNITNRKRLGTAYTTHVFHQYGHLRLI